MWDRITPLLAHRYRIIRFDPRGAGSSTSDPALEYSRPADAEDLDHLLNHLQIPKIHLVGHSKGARIALQFAMRWPERAISVIAIGSAEPHPDGGEMASFRPIVEAWVQRARGVAQSEGALNAVELLSKGGLFGKLRATPEGVRQLRRSMAGYAAADLLSTRQKRSFHARSQAAKLTMPVLFLAGEDDPFLPECRYAHGQVSASSFRVLPRCGHMAPLERPEATAEAILKFLGRD
jgi:pimeloyl-ACP methyl ester carboxylesterase